MEMFTANVKLVTNKETANNGHRTADTLLSFQWKN